MPRVVIGDLLTGRRILELPYVSYRWELRRNAPESLSAVTTLVDPDVRALSLRNTATPGKTVLGIVEDAGGVEWMPGAGPMNNPGYDRDTQRLTFDAAGVWSFFSGRSVLPVAALTTPEAQFLIPDPSDATKTMPNPALATQFDGLEYGTIMKRLVQQALAWPSSSLPVRFEDDRVGTRISQRYEAVDFKRVADAIADITKYVGGPDVRFEPRYQADRLGIEWLLRTGTDAKQHLSSPDTFRWNFAVPDSGAKGLTVSYSTDNIGSVSWATGGRSQDTAMVSRSVSTDLTDRGFPLREVLDSSHSDVSIASTLRGYGEANLLRAQKPTELWKFQAHKQAPPFIGSYNLGDYCELTVQGDPYIPDGVYRRQIAGLSGDQGDWVTITTMEV